MNFPTTAWPSFSTPAAAAPVAANARQTAADEWSALTDRCRAGLSTAVGGTQGQMLSALHRAEAGMPALNAAAQQHGIDPALLAGVGIRETGFRNIDQIGGGDGRGTFQIDTGKNPGVTEAQANDPGFATDWAANRLAENSRALAANHPNFDGAQALRATAASYNFGTGNVSGNPDTIDVGTTGNNYGANVVDLMDCFR